MLAQFLLTMADSVESGDAQDNGWHLSLSPDDIPAMRTHNVISLSLGCTPATAFYKQNRTVLMTKYRNQTGAQSRYRNPR